MQTKSGVLRAAPLLSALIFITTAATAKRLMSVRMAVANERAIFVLVNIVVSPVNRCSHLAGARTHLVSVNGCGKSALCTGQIACRMVGVTRESPVDIGLLPLGSVRKVDAFVSRLEYQVGYSSHRMVLELLKPRVDHGGALMLYGGPLPLMWY